MAFDDDFLRRLRERASIARYAGAKLAFDQRKSQPARGDYWACCPFHGEKTASFHVLDRRGLYKCFGCGEAGDIFKLAMKLEGYSFREAVEKIAADAGVPLPDEGPRDRAAEARRGRLGAALAAAQEAFRAALNGPEGAAARAYLAKRGLGDPATQAQFGLGWAPAGWTWLAERLAGAFKPEELAEAGLIRDTQDGRRKVDLFRARLTFPIADAQGRVIGFGGRLIEPGEPKYLNSPETPLFSKGRTLYRLGPARALAARSKAQGLVVAEGYLDVIACERAGVAAVAPLGTALTDDQLDLVWRSGGSPILCFDGDAAGLRAAHRALDLALPHLGPERTVRFALLPQGQDPDDLYRAKGPEALAAALAGAIPAVDALFARERDRAPLDTPEAKAGLKQRLKDCAGRIGHEETRRQYLRELLSRADALWRPAGVADGAKSAQRGGWKPGFAATRGGRRAPPPVQATAAVRESLSRRRAAGEIEGLLRLAIDRPALLERHAEPISELAIADSALDRIRHAALDLLAAGETVDREAVSRHLHSSGETEAASRIAGWPATLWGDGVDADLVEKAAEAQWMALLSLNVMRPGIGAEVAAAGARRGSDSGGSGEIDSAEFARLQAQIAAQRDRAAAALRFGDGPPEDEADAGLEGH